MKIIHAKDYNDLSRKAANIISAQVILKPESVLGLATGSSPLGIYRQLIIWYEKGDLDFSATTAVNLDEYCNLPPDNPQSYHAFISISTLPGSIFPTAWPQTWRQSAAAMTN